MKAAVRTREGDLENPGAEGRGLTIVDGESSRWANPSGSYACLFELERPRPSAETPPAATLEASVKLPRRVSAQRRGLVPPAPHAPGRVQRHYGSKAGVPSPVAAAADALALPTDPLSLRHTREAAALAMLEIRACRDMRPRVRCPGWSRCPPSGWGRESRAQRQRCGSVASRRWWLGRGALVGAAGRRLGSAVRRCRWFRLCAIRASARRGGGRVLRRDGSRWRGFRSRRSLGRRSASDSWRAA